MTKEMIAMFIMAGMTQNNPRYNHALSEWGHGEVEFVQEVADLVVHDVFKAGETSQLTTSQYCYDVMEPFGKFLTDYVSQFGRNPVEEEWRLAHAVLYEKACVEHIGKPIGKEFMLDWVLDQVKEYSPAPSTDSAEPSEPEIDPDLLPTWSEMPEGAEVWIVDLTDHANNTTGWYKKAFNHKLNKPCWYHIGSEAFIPWLPDAEERGHIKVIHPPESGGLWYEHFRVEYRNKVGGYKFAIYFGDEESDTIVYSAPTFGEMLKIVNYHDKVCKDRAQGDVTKFVTMPEALDMVKKHKVKQSDYFFKVGGKK